MDGAEFKSGRQHSFTVAVCIGASWIFGGTKGPGRAGQHGRDRWLGDSGGAYWLREPPEEYLLGVWADEAWP